MSDDERIRRPRLDRTQPIRSWARLLGLPTLGEASASGASGAADDVVARSVGLGYRVVEEYIRQGRRAAEQLGVRGAGAAPFGSDVQDLGLRMMRYAADLMGAWMQLMEATSAGVGRSPAQPSSPPTGANGPPTAPVERAAIRIEVASLWPTEVWLDLRPEATRVAVEVPPLRAVDPEKPRLDDVALIAGADGDPPLLRVRVPPSQPAGVYNGLLIDRDTSRPVGTVSVRVTRD